jgi:hypothetical protein
VRIWSRAIQKKIICPGSSQFNKNTSVKQASMAWQLCEKNVYASEHLQIRRARYSLKLPTDQNVLTTYNCARFRTADWSVALSVELTRQQLANKMQFVSQLNAPACSVRLAQSRSPPCTKDMVQPNRYEQYAFPGKTENLMISVAFDYVCSYLVAAYRWSFIGQKRWLVT